jgi:molybdate transport system regulatory protein
MNTTAEFDAHIGAEGTVFGARDAALLRAVDEHGSLNRAAEALERSFSHAQQRIVELEDAFGPLVERRRGGPGGGGSELTDEARTLLARFDLLRADFSGVAEATRTVLAGTVTDRDGELVTVETAAGTVTALASANGTDVEVSVRADMVTLTAPDDAPEPTGTSARNTFAGRAVGIESGETVARVAVDVGADDPLRALLTHASVETLGLAPGSEVVASFKATATHVIPRKND